MTLAEGAELVGLGLVRDQLLARVVSLVGLLLQVAATATFLDLSSL